MKQADRHGAGEPTDGTTENDQSQIVFKNEAIENLVHYRPLQSICNDGTNGAFVVTAAVSTAAMVNKALNGNRSGAQSGNGAGGIGNYPEIPGTNSPPVSTLSDEPAKSFPIG
jgi:hypothetical protein